MSVVAWDGKVIAADRQGTIAEMRVVSSKMRRTAEAVLAWTGNQECGLALADWYERGASKDAWPKFQDDMDRWTRLIVADMHGIRYYEQEPVPQYVQQPFIAFGSGRDFAMGAMAMGASAERAVQVASEFCVSCGMGVEVMEVPHG